MRRIFAAVLFLCPSFLFAQTVKPTSLAFEAVPKQTSPQQLVAFNNTGESQLTLSITVIGPFAMPLNDCGFGVKPGTHCNVGITYTPNALQQDAGFLIFGFNDGSTATVALSGSGVSVIPTVMIFIQQRNQYRLGHDVAPGIRFYVDVDKKFGYQIPYGEIVNFSCSTGSETVSLSAEIKPSKSHAAPVHGVAQVDFIPDQIGAWHCTATYPGDGVLGPSSDVWDFEIVAK